MEEKLKLYMLFIIVDRKKGSKITDMLDDKGLHFHVIFLGRGTANSDILEYLGLGESEKDIIVSVVNDEKVKDIFEELKTRFGIETPAQGVAFTVPVNSIGGLNKLKQYTENL
ncbi:MAG TPA: hypothetical protein VIL26_02025 [Clostridia bacterium]